MNTGGNCPPKFLYLMISDSSVKQHHRAVLYFEYWIHMGPVHFIIYQYVTEQEASGGW